jgi:hypothetical protein
MNRFISIGRRRIFEFSFTEIDIKLSTLWSQSRRDPRNITFDIITTISNTIRRIITSINRNCKCFCISIKCKSNYISIFPFTSKFLTTIVKFLNSITIDSETTIIITYTFSCIFFRSLIEPFSYPSHLWS